MNDDDLKKLAALMWKKWGPEESIARITAMRSNQISGATCLKLVKLINEKEKEFHALLRRKSASPGS